MLLVQALCLVYHARLTKPGVFTHWEKWGWTVKGQRQRDAQARLTHRCCRSDFALFLTPAPK